MRRASAQEWPAIDAVAKDLGLGEKTGVELFEEQGHRANAESKEALYADDPSRSGWYDADTLMLSIGQSECMFTPIQLGPIHCFGNEACGAKFVAKYVKLIL